MCPWDAWIRTSPGVSWETTAFSMKANLCYWNYRCASVSFCPGGTCSSIIWPVSEAPLFHSLHGIGEQDFSLLSGGFWALLLKITKCKWLHEEAVVYLSSWELQSHSPCPAVLNHIWTFSVFSPNGTPDSTAHEATKTKTSSLLPTSLLKSHCRWLNSGHVYLVVNWEFVSGIQSHLQIQSGDVFLVVAYKCSHSQTGWNLAEESGYEVKGTIFKHLSLK